MINVSDKICRENHNKYVIFNNVLLENRAVLWDNVKEYGIVRQAVDDIIWRMHFACWMTKVTKKNQEM